MSTSTADSSTLYVVRNEVDPDCEYHCDAVAARVPDAVEVDFVGGERPPLEDADGVVLTGSTAAVYEADSRPWIADQEALVRELVKREIPTLGVCFGHQVANAALGGTVEEVGTTATLVETDLADDPLFEDVDPVVPAVHGDAVTEPGEGMAVIAAADHAPVFGTRHRSAPLWTVQFHPEITAAVRDRLAADFGWESRQFSFADVSAERVFENFERLVAERTA
ncbi:type 1 glutamine amidotransferase [Natronococcus occultus]|uniref:GMP synthase family protein n=1 Tax=Natronococcus occultus SP4 TaxID=694430 RepID=L0JZG5_9EURY|nr:type 1 glutamine amidotransferase [Natronococcus occultus]AGB37258.1 GMP synthase family protein [Natronococcus occultus SP4]